MENMRHSFNFYVRFAFADVLFRLHLKFDQLKPKAEKATMSAAVQVYCGGKIDGSCSIKKTTPSAVWFPSSLVKLFPDTENQKDPLI